MSDFYTSYLSPYRNLGLSFISPCPLDLDGPYTATIRPDLAVSSSTGFGGPLAFPTNIYSMLHRNWKPLSWDAIGTASIGFSGLGYAAAPGTVDVNNPLIFETYEGIVDAEIEALSERVAIQPDWSLPSPQRKMIQWGVTNDDGPYPQSFFGLFGEGIHPIYVDENGNNPTGWYVVMRVSFSALFEPYLWFRGNNFYLEQEVSMEIVVFASPDQDGSPAPEGWNPQEGNFFNGGGVSLFSQRFGAEEAVANVRIQDLTGIDPTPNWGSIQLFGSPSVTADLTLRVKSNYLPHPGYS